MKKFFIFFLLPISLLRSENLSSFTYTSINTMGTYPMFATGFRGHKGLHGLDISLSFCPTNLPKSLSIFHLKSLYCLFPMQNSLYLAAGFGMLNDPKSIHLSSTIETSLGFQFKNRFFLEANGLIPTKQTTQNFPIWPGITVGYGF
jgi:hypothetical protein